jgi:hypothetical protein
MFLRETNCEEVTRKIFEETDTCHDFMTRVGAEDETAMKEKCGGANSRAQKCSRTSAVSV